MYLYLVGKISFTAEDHTVEVGHNLKEAGGLAIIKTVLGRDVHLMLL